MGLSRKRERELKRLKNSASDLWEDQREVLEHASKVVREAGKQVGHIGREEVAPRVRGTIDHRIMPTVASGFAATRHVADSAKDKVTHEILPSVASAIASALAVIEVAKDAKVKEVNHQLTKASKKASKKASQLGKKASKAGNRLGTKLGVVEKRRGPASYIMIAVGVVAAAGVAYAAWQTLREDDDLWVSDDIDSFEQPNGIDSGNA